MTDERLALMCDLLDEFAAEHPHLVSDYAMYLANLSEWPTPPRIGGKKAQTEFRRKVLALKQARLNNTPMSLTPPPPAQPDDSVLTQARLEMAKLDALAEKAGVRSAEEMAQLEMKGTS